MNLWGEKFVGGMDMALVHCRHCRRAFISAPQDKDYCPECTGRLRKLYPLVRGYMRDNEKRVFSIQDISEELDIDMRDIKGLMGLGLIDTRGR